MSFSRFSRPIFLRIPECASSGLPAERQLLPKRAGALWEGPVPFGRNRESRSREAAGRRNWPEAVPEKMRGRKRRRSKSVRIAKRSGLESLNDGNYSYLRATIGSTF